MRYLKRFNESVDLENDLRDFCEMNLAYLLDNDDFRLSVIWQGHGNMGRSKDCYNINLCNLDEGIASAGFTWNEVKDYYIPFLHMLNNEYKIMSNEDLNVGKRFDRQDAGDLEEPCIALYNGAQNFCVSVEDILSGDPLPGRYDDVLLLEITLRVEMKNKLVE